MNIETDILIDKNEKVLAFCKYPNTFWVDMIRQSIEERPIIQYNKFYIFLQSLYDDYFSKGYCFIVDEEWEGHDINQILSSENYPYTLFDILDLFKENYNITHRFFCIISSNLYYHFYKKSDYIYSYLHWLKVTNFIPNDDWWNPSKKEITYKFLYLNRVPKYERSLLYDEILKLDILDSSIWSWNAVNYLEYDGQQTNHISKALENNFIDFDDEQTLLIEPDNPSLKVFCSLLVESETEQENLFISEKTAKCIIHEVPFIAFASYNFLDTLKKLGFKTFDRWWDESYDKEKDLSKRIKKISNVVSYINSKSLNELKSMYDDMKEVLTHNKKLYYDIHNSETKTKLTKKPNTFNKMHKILRVGGDLSTKFEIKKVKVENIL
jgi:hypothetical protein